MSLGNKKLLVYSNNPETLERIQASIDPIHDHTIYSKDIKDATFRIENQVFGAIIYGAKEELSDPLGLFDWVTQRHDYKNVPWIILDLNQSASDTLGEKEYGFPYVVLDEQWTTKALFSAFDTIFPPGNEPKKVVDPKVLTPIVTACTSALHTKSNIELDRKPPYVLADGEPSKFGGDLSIKIRFETSEFKFSVLLSFQTPFALAINKHLKGSDKTSLDTEVTASLKSFGIQTFNNIQEALGKLNLEVQNLGVEIKEKLDVLNRHEIFGLNLCLPFETQKGPVTIECVAALKSKT